MLDSKTVIKKMNRNRIFRYLLEKAQAPLLDVSRDLEISLPTVTQHVLSLEKENLLEEAGLYESTGGRRARVIACDPRTRVACGINITHRTADIVIIDLCGNLVDYSNMVLNCTINHHYLSILRDKLSDMLQEDHLRQSQVLGVGVSLPAIIDKNKIIRDTAFDAPLPPDFQEMLRSYLPFRLDYCNDASSGGYAEFWHCKDVENLFYLSLCGSVGGAARIHSQFYDGDDDRSAEIGHTTIVPNGRLCYCGRRGCMNAYCSSNNLTEATGGSLELFFKKLEAGDPVCVQKWNEYLGYLSIAVNNIRMLFDCNVILGGSVGKYIPRYIPGLQARLLEFDSFHRPTEYVLPCKYHSESSAVGAALMFIDQFISEI